MPFSMDLTPGFRKKGKAYTISRVADVDPCVRFLHRSPMHRILLFCLFGLACTVSAHAQTPTGGNTPPLPEPEEESVTVAYDELIRYVDNTTRWVYDVYYLEDWVDQIRNHYVVLNQRMNAESNLPTPSDRNVPQTSTGVVSKPQ
jgi:hypothetical protein